jgi:PEP-CTERM motif
MRRVILLALLAFALPTVALADSIDFAFGGHLGTTASTAGTAAANSTYSVTSSLLDMNFAPASGTVKISTGTLSSCSAGLCFTGGAIDVWNSSNQLLFQGSFDGTLTNSNGVISINANAGGNPVVAGFTFLVSKTGSVSGDFSVTTPEPGTLGLIGTGLIGLAGLARRKLRA